MGPEPEKSINDVCQELGLEPQFLRSLAENASNFYHIFEKPKRAGGFRKISAAQDQLKTVQRLILDVYLSRQQLPSYLHGCIKGRSIVTNAKEHADQELVVKIDLKDFFGSINPSMIEGVFRGKLNFDQETASLFSRLTTYQEALPQGAPTSPVLANLAAISLDEEIIRVCSKHAGQNSFRYTRYVDDLTISGGKSLQELLPLIYDVISRSGFRANAQKTKLLRQHTRQWVTGLVVNKKANAPKKFIRKIRQALYYCRRYGIKEHCETRDIAPERFIRNMRGQIGFIRMTQPELADVYSLMLNEVAQDLQMSEVEQNLRYLKHIIDEEQTAEFFYDDSHRKAAPAEILLNENGHVIVRAFQLSPEQGWRMFLLSDIHHLHVPGDRL